MSSPGLPTLVAPAAHGIGGPHDLPLPVMHVIAGSALALVASFTVLALARRTPHRPAASGRPAPRWLAGLVESSAVRAALVVAAAGFTAWVGMAAWLGEDSLVNPTFGVVFVLLWVGLVPAGLLFGRIYRWCNPLRWVHRLICLVLRRDPGRGLLPLPSWVGVWPAAASLFAFVWLELVDADLAADLGFVRGWFLVVGVLLVAGAVVFGSEFFAAADPFEVFSTLAAGMSPWGRRNDGALLIRSPFASLDALPVSPGLLGVTSVLFGATCFDAFRASTVWLRLVAEQDVDPVWVNTAGLVVFCAAVFVSLRLASAVMSRIGGLDRTDLQNQLAPSIVPIIVGYTVAHYLSYFASAGLMTLQQLGDPLTRGWSLAAPLQRLDTYAIFDHPELIAVTKVVAVVVGHVIGIVVAHERSLQLLPRRRALVGQLPMLALMVTYTVTGLWLLFYD